MTIRVYISEHLQNYPNIKNLAKDFKQYKTKQQTDFLSYKFGKDVSYNRPQSAVQAELQHVHIVPINHNGNTSDRCLVYTTGFTDDNAFLMLTMFEPNAHELSRNTIRMVKLADIAEIFRNQF